MTVLGRVSVVGALVILVLVSGAAWVGRLTPRVQQLTYLSRSSSTGGASGLSYRVMLADPRHGVQAPLFVPAGEPFNAAWSPDGETLAYRTLSTAQQIHLYHAPMNRTTTLPLSSVVPQSDASFAWSPDGQKIAFSGYATDSAGVLLDNYTDVYVFDIRTGDLRNVTDRPFSQQAPQWSPGGDDVLLMVNAVMSGGRTFDLLAVDMGTGDAYPLDGRRSGHFAWLPGGGGFYTLTIDGDEAVLNDGEPDEQRFRLPLPTHWNANDVSWAVDAQQVVVQSTVTGSHDLTLLNLETGAQTTVADWRTYEGQPAISPDGRWVAYVATLNGNDEIMLYDIDRSSRFRLTRTYARDWRPFWRPGA